MLRRLFACCCLISLLFGCGGGGDSPVTATGPGPSAPGPELVAALVEVSSAEKGSLTASWLPASADAAAQAAASYELHVSAGETDFVPGTSTLKYQGKDLSAKIDGLAAGRHNAKLVVQGSGQRSVSAGRSVSVAETSAKQVGAAPVVVLSPAQLNSADVAAGQVTLASGTAAPAAGTVLASDKDGGLLQRVVGTQALADGRTSVSTEPVALNSVLSSLSLSSSVSLLPLADATSTGQSGLALRRTATGASAHWPQSGLTLSDANVTGAPTDPRRQVLRVSRADAPMFEASTQRSTFAGDWGSMSVPLLIGIQENQGARAQSFGVEINLSDKTKEVCDLRVVSDGASGRLAQREGRTIFLTSQGVAPGPYAVVIELVLGKVGDNCVRNYWAPVKDLLTAHPSVRTTVTVTTESQKFSQQSKTLQYQGGVSVSNSVDFQFDPQLQIEIEMPSSDAIKSARFELNATTFITQTLRVEANGSAQLERSSQTLIKPRKFTKVFVAGGVPVVIEGEFWLDVEVEASANGRISASEELRLGFAKLSYGVRYDGQTGAWAPYKTAEPTYELTLQGAADATATVKVTLLPKMKVQVYRLPTVRLTLAPSLEAEVGLHGQLLLNKQPLGTTADADAWLTKGELRGEIKAYIYAGLEVFNNKKIVSLPVNAVPDDHTTHHRLELVGSTTLVGLPVFQAQRLADKHPTDARAILIRATAVDVQSPFRRFAVPFGPETFLPFSAWHSPKVLAANDEGYSWIQPPIGVSSESSNGRVHTKDYWLVLTKPGQYRVRLGGHSAMGSWARQIADELTLVHQDPVCQLPLVLTNGICTTPVVAAASGSLTLSAAGCQVAVGQSTCVSLNATWTTSGATSPRLLKTGSSTALSTLASMAAPGLAVVVTYPQTTFSLMDGSTLLASKTATASCASPGVWNGSICTTATAAPVAPTLTAPASGATGLSLTPTLQWSNGSAAYWQINMRNTATGVALAPITLAGTQTSYSLGAGLLQAGAVYGWDVKACVDQACSESAAAKSATSTFTTAQQFPLSLSVAGQGGGSIGYSGGLSCNSNCTPTYPAGASVTLTATAASGWGFTGWTGACNGAGACTVTMNAAKSVTAGFILNAPVTPTVNAANVSITSAASGYQDVPISGSGFTTSSWHQLSVNNGSWTDAADAPYNVGANTLTVAVSKVQQAGTTVRVRVCASKGSGGVNCSAGMVTATFVAAAAPDLVPSGFWVTYFVGPTGRYSTVAFNNISLSNLGNAAAAASVTRFEFLNSSGVLQLPATDYPTPALGANGVVSFTGTTWDLSSLAPGQYILRITADATGTAGQTNKANDKVSDSFTLY